MQDEIEMNEPAEVIAAFRRGKKYNCWPVRFVFKNREVEVKEIGLAYPIRKNGALHYIFDITDGQADYRLELNTARLVWYVTREADHYGAA